MNKLDKTYKIGDYIITTNNFEGARAGLCGIIRKFNELLVGIEFEGNFGGHDLDCYLPNTHGYYIPLDSVRLFTDADYKIGDEVCCVTNHEDIRAGYKGMISSIPCNDKQPWGIIWEKYKNGRRLHANEIEASFYYSTATFCKAFVYKELTKNKISFFDMIEGVKL